MVILKYEFWRDIDFYIVPKLIFFLYFWRNIDFYITPKLIYLLWYVPRLQTSMSMEIPNPIHVKINRGSCDLEVVLQDILALTKLNYNACVYGDGLPVTLKFSNIIGDILTASGNIKSSQRKFIYYI